MTENGKLGQAIALYMLVKPKNAQSKYKSCTIVTVAKNSRHMPTFMIFRSIVSMPRTKNPLFLSDRGKPIGNLLQQVCLEGLEGWGTHTEVYLPQDDTYTSNMGREDV